MFHVIMKFKNFILCHELYIILIIIFQYSMKFIYKSYVLCHHEIYFISFCIGNSLTFMSLQIQFYVIY